ncbi:hypothetical protein GCM10028798_09790 [Humibacter antri]
MSAALPRTRRTCAVCGVPTNAKFCLDCAIELANSIRPAPPSPPRLSRKARARLIRDEMRTAYQAVLDDLEAVSSR